jgi:hypothetical protein
MVTCSHVQFLSISVTCSGNAMHNRNAYIGLRNIADHKGSPLLHSAPAPKHSTNAWVQNNNRDTQKIRNIPRTQQRLPTAKRPRGLGIRREHMGNRRLSPEKGLHTNPSRRKPAKLHGAFRRTHTDGNGNRRNYTPHLKRIMTIHYDK